jgi:hypothetical protein
VTPSVAAAFDPPSTERAHVKPALCHHELDPKSEEADDRGQAYDGEAYSCLRGVLVEHPCVGREQHMEEEADGRARERGGHASKGKGRPHENAFHDGTVTGATTRDDECNRSAVGALRSSTTVHPFLHVRPDSELVPPSE